MDPHTVQFHLMQVLEASAWIGGLLQVERNGVEKYMILQD